MSDHLRLCAAPGCRNVTTREPRCAIHRRGGNGHDATETPTEGSTQMSDDLMNDLIRGHRAEKAAQTAAALGFASPDPLEQARLEARQALADYEAAPEAGREQAGERVNTALNRVRELAAAQDAPPPPDFGGGAREPGPPPPPSMGSLLRAMSEEAKERVYRHAADLDHQNRHNQDD